MKEKELFNAFQRFLSVHPVWATAIIGVISSIIGGIIGGIILRKIP